MAKQTTKKAKQANATKRMLGIIGGLVALLLIVVVVGSLTGLFGGRDKGIEVETAKAETRTLTQVVTASGRVQPEVEVVISPDVSGEIIELRVREGDQVQQGQLMARIQPDFYAAQVEQAQAGVLERKAAQAQRRADMLGAEAELKRQKELKDKGVIAASQYEQAETTYEVAKAAYEAAEFSVRSAEARLRESRESLGKTALYAPMTGTVSKLDVELGERVVGTSQMQGTEMMRIARLDQMELEIDVNENDVVNVAEGDTAAIEIDAYPEKSFKGVVTEIANSARVSAMGTQEQVTNFPVKIRILDRHNVDERVASADNQGSVVEQEVPLAANAFPIFRPGMSGTVDIFTKTVEDVIAVPIQAVTVRDINAVDRRDSQDDDEEEDEETDSTDSTPAVEDLRKVVFTVVDGAATMIEVQTGIGDDTHIEIKSGLAGGEVVVIGPYRVVSRTLDAGDRVQVDEAPAGRRGNTVAAAQ